MSHSHSFLLVPGLEGQILYAVGVVFLWLFAGLLLAFFALWLLGDGRISSGQGDDPS